MRKGATLLVKRAHRHPAATTRTRLAPRRRPSPPRRLAARLAPRTAARLTAPASPLPRPTTRPSIVVNLTVATANITPILFTLHTI